MTASAAMSFCRQRAAAQGGGTVPHQLRELARQLSQGMGTPGGLCLGDHRFLQQEHGQCGNAAEQRTHQIKAGKPQKPPQYAGKGAERAGQHADLGAVGSHGKIPFFLPGLLQAVVGQSGIGAGKHGVGQGVQPHCRTNQEKAGRKCHEQAAQHCQDTARHKGPFTPQQVGGHSAGHLAQQADDMVNALGKADLPQREPAGGQQRHPYGIRDAQAGKEIGQIDAAQLLFQMNSMIHGEHPFCFCVKQCPISRQNKNAPQQSCAAHKNDAPRFAGRKMGTLRAGNA